MSLLWGPGTHGAADLGAMFVHFMLLSLLAIGGAITTTADMHRWLVRERGWLADAEFTASIALAQAAPGPNVLFVAVLGWNVAGLAGAFAALAGSLLPSTTLALTATRWGAARRDAIGVRAFTTGLAPLTIGMLLATGWVLTEPLRAYPMTAVLVLLAVVLMTRTKASPLWAIAAGAVAGALGWVG